MTEYKLVKRSLILSAAAEVFGEKGYHSAKIEDIARQAGIGKGTVYEYFQSKEQLFRAALKEGINAVNQVLREQIEQEHTTRGKLIAFTKKTLEIGRQYRVIAKLLMLDLSFMDREFHDWLVEIYRQRIKALEAVINEGIEKGQIRPLNVTCLALVFSGGIVSACGPYSGVEMEAENGEGLAAEIVDYFLKGVACG